MSEDPNSLLQLSPAARRIVRELRRQVLANQIRPGNPLPSVRTLAKRTGLSAFPVQQALKHIEREGWAERNNHKGRLRLVTTARAAARRGLEHEPPLILTFVSPVHRPLSYEYQLASVARQMAAIFDRCSTRQLYFDPTKGADPLRHLFEENERIPNEVGYVLSRVPPTFQALFRAQGVPCVVTGYVDPALNLPCVYEDMNHIGLLVGRALCPAGPVVAIHFDELVGAEVNIIDGVRRAAREVGAVEPAWEEFYVSVPEDLVECESHIERLLTGRNRPAGIFAMRPEIAMLVLRSALRRGIRVPDELQIIGYGSRHQPMYELVYPAITSVGWKSNDELASRLAALLARSLGERPKVAPRESLESELVERQTTRPLRAADDRPADSQSRR